MGRYHEIKNQTADVVGIRLVRKLSTAKAHAAIRDLIVASPALSYQLIADQLGCSRWLILPCGRGIRPSDDPKARAVPLGARRNGEAQKVF